MKRILTIAATSLFALSVVVPAFSQDSGAAIYKAKCMMCHKADGTGMAAMKVPSFKSPEMKKASDASLIAAINKGKGMMPAYAGKLSASQIKGVVEYIRTLQK